MREEFPERANALARHVIFCFYSFIRLKGLLPGGGAIAATMRCSLSCSSSALHGAAIPVPTLQAVPKALGIKLCRWSAPKRPWKVLLAVFWAPWRLVWSSRWYTRWQQTGWKPSPAPTLASIYVIIALLGCGSGGAGHLWRSVCQRGQASAASRITAPSSRGTAAF